MADIPAATEVAVTVIPTPSDEVVSDPFEYALAEDLFGNDAAADIALSDGMFDRAIPTPFRNAHCGVLARLLIR